MRSNGAQAEPSSVAARRLIQVVEARFADGLSAARVPTAAGPADASAPGGAEALRHAYLDLLKLALADLVATSTTSVARNQLGDVMSRELAGADLKVRAAGLDWPLHGLTMLGLKRLDDLQECVEQVVTDKIPGDLVEAGSWRGGAAMLMRATLDAHGETGRTVWVADSFQGFPAAPPDAEKDGYDLWADLASADFLAVPLDEVKEAFARLGLASKVNFVPGFFQDTLPTLTGRTWSLVRLDGDTYESVRVGLDALYPGLSVGGYLVIDDYGSLDECREAVQDYRREHGIEEPIEQIDWSGARWRREREPDAPTKAVKAAATTKANPGEPQTVERGPRKRVPALAEVELQEELERVQERLDRAEAELNRAKHSPIAALTIWGRAVWVRTLWPQTRALWRRTPLATPVRRARAAVKRRRHALRGDA